MTIDKLKFKKTDKAVLVEGKAAPNSDVVVENKSLAPFAPVDTPDAFARAKAGADGSFTVTLPAAREGDRLKVQAGESATAVRVSNVEPTDGRPPVVRQQGLRLVRDDRGVVRFEQACKSTVIGEPGQVLQMTNTRTREKASFTLDGDGRLPKSARLHAEPGDAFQLATSDGAFNTNFTDGCGLLVVPPNKGTEPAPAAQGGPTKLQTVPGPLFAADSPRVATVKQGQIGNCWLVSAVDAVLARDPKIIKDMIKENADGTFTVTFKRFDHDKHRYVDEPITVTRELYVKPWGGALLFGSSTSGDLWFPLLEKAYAVWKGGYDGVRSGYPFEAFEALLGAEGRHFDLDVTAPDALWTALEARQKRGEAMAAWTRLDTPELRFANTGLAQDHAYAILGVEVVDGKRMVKLRNPWGSNGAGGNLIVAGQNGESLMTLENFVSRFLGLGSVATR